MKEFKINQYIDLKLEEGKTNIYIKNEKFIQCKFLLLEIDEKNVALVEKIQSIDEAEESLDISEEWKEIESRKIPPETEFWGHCSNLQVWEEHNYDTKLLHRNLAFPLLKKLSDVGDFQAQKVFRKEIISRLTSKHPTVLRYLISEGYLNYLKENEVKMLLSDSRIIEQIIKLKNFDDENFKSLYLVIKKLKEISPSNYRKVIKRVLISKNEQLIGFLDEFFDYSSLFNTEEIAVKLLNQKEAKIIAFLRKIRGEKLFFSLLISKIDTDIVIERGHVVKLNLNRWELTKIPTQVFKLKFIKTIWLEHNELEVLPSSIEKLSMLRKLYLGGNKLTALPEEIGNLTELVELSVNNNFLASIPNSIKRLKYLKKMDVTHNKFDESSDLVKELKKKIKIVYV